MFNYLFITNIPEIAAFAESCGVTRIFVDLETKGKLERQGHLDTVISEHSFDDIENIKRALTSSELLVRLNPFYEDSKKEVDNAISKGADIIMLPMIKNIDQVIDMGAFINGRAKFIPLIETIASAEIVNDIDMLECVDEIHIGLNDLHLEFGLSFMFELITNGYVDEMVAKLTKPFGIGGIARVNQGEVSGQSVMAQHVRLNSSSVILSRAFHLKATSLYDLKNKIDLEKEIALLNGVRNKLLLETNDKREERFLSFNQSVAKVVA